MVTHWLQLTCNINDIKKDTGVDIPRNHRYEDHGSTDVAEVGLWEEADTHCTLFHLREDDGVLAKSHWSRLKSISIMSYRLVASNLDLLTVTKTIWMIMERLVICYCVYHSNSVYTHTHTHTHAQQQTMLHVSKIQLSQLCTHYVYEAVSQQCHRSVTVGLLKQTLHTCTGSDVYIPLILHTHTHIHTPRSQHWNVIPEWTWKHTPIHTHLHALAD